MFAVLYRWQVKPGREDEFRDAWHRATEAIYQHRGSLGSPSYAGRRRRLLRARPMAKPQRLARP